MTPKKNTPRATKLVIKKETLSKLEDASLGQAVGANNSLPPVCRLTPRICTP